jgi:hypothetical protein
MLRAKLLAVSTAAGLGLLAPQAQAFLDNNNVTVIESCSGNSSSFDDDHANHQSSNAPDATNTSSGDQTNSDTDNNSVRSCSFLGGYEGLNGLPGLPGGLPVDPEALLADPAGYIGSLVPGGLPGGLPVDPEAFLADPAGYLASLVPGGLPGDLPVDPDAILADPAGFLGGLPGMLPPLPVNPDDVLANVLDVVGSAVPSVDVELHVLGIDVLIHGGLVIPTLP